MSATCPRGNAAGFTLLELVVVLTIMGLAAALATPSLLNGIDSWRARDVLDRVQDSIRALPAQARIAGRTVVVGAKDAPAVVELDPEWSLSAVEPWSVRANGYCEGGDVVLRKGDREWTLRATAPFCDVEVLR